MPELHPIDILPMALYFIGVLVLGFVLGRGVKTEQDYFLAGRSLPFWAIGLSIVGSDIGAMDFVGLVGSTYDNGVVMANFDWIGSLPALILAALIFVPYYWRAGVYSVPEYLGRRYNQKVRLVQTVAWTCFLVLNLGNMLWAAAQALRGLLGWHEWITIPVAAAVVGIYTITGGLAAVVYTDLIQVFLMFLGGALVLILGVVKLGGLGELHDRIVEAGHTHHFSLYHATDAGTPYPWHMILLGLVLVQSQAYFIGNQNIVQRALGARDEWHAKAGTLFACFFKFGIPFIVVAPGLVGLALYPDLEKAGLTGSDQIFSRMVNDLLPLGIRGIVLTAFVSALTSNADSAVSSAATLITRDFYIGFCGGSADGKKLLSIGRWVTFAVLLLAIAAAPLTQLFSGVYVAIQSMLAVIQGPTLGILLPAMFWARSTPAAGLASVLAGLGLSISLTVYQKAAPSLGLGAPFNADEPFFAIAFLSFALTIAVNIAVSLCTRPRPREELEGLIYRWWRNGSKT